MSERKLVGFANFKRHNPMSDRFQINRFRHIEFYTSDALNISRRFTWGMGMHLVAKSDLSTGNTVYASYVVQSGQCTMIFTAPYNNRSERGPCMTPHPGFDTNFANQFIIDHGLGVRAMGLEVGDAAEAFRVSVANGGIPVLEPHELVDRTTGKTMVLSEIKMFGDCVVRFMSGDFTSPGFPNYETVNSPDLSFGIDRVDHAVSNVPQLFPAVDYLCGALGFHEFGEFTSEDVGTVDSGLNSMVLANNNEFVLLPVNEPTFGTRRKSQIQTYLEQNNGSGIQHIAVKTDDIFLTVREMRKRSLCGGFEFMPTPAHSYYENIFARTGEQYSPEKLAELEELGILVDKDDQGVLLQLFTTPVGDRTTVFIEVIQRVGCDLTPTGERKEQAAGCGGFGKGNFGELFKRLEEYEKQQEDAAILCKGTA